MSTRNKGRATQLRRINAIDFEGEALRRGYLKVDGDRIFLPMDAVEAMQAKLRSGIEAMAKNIDPLHPLRMMGAVLNQLEFSEHTTKRLQEAIESEAAK